jgi:hypothetical protein
MRLKFHALATGIDGVVHHLNRLVEVAFVVDADFGDDERWMRRADRPSRNFERSGQITPPCV